MTTTCKTCGRTSEVVDMSNCPFCHPKPEAEVCTTPSGWEEQLSPLLIQYAKGFADTKVSELEYELRAERDAKAVYGFIRTLTKEFYDKGYASGRKDKEALGK